MKSASSTPLNSTALPRGVSTMRGCPRIVVGWPPMRSSLSKVHTSCAWGCAATIPAASAAIHRMRARKRINICSSGRRCQHIQAIRDTQVSELEEQVYGSARAPVRQYFVEVIERNDCPHVARKPFAVKGSQGVTGKLDLERSLAHILI